MRRRRPQSRPPGVPKKEKTPKVGIIFVVRDRVWIEATPTTEGEQYCDYVNHARSHEHVWAEFQAQGHASRDEDYMSAPRGRVVFCTRTSQCSLFLDRCILKKSQPRARNRETHESFIRQHKRINRCSLQRPACMTSDSF